jgi:membrane-anchored protein YejM (alkaline phosphatase superfamily)
MPAAAATGLIVFGSTHMLTLTLHMCVMYYVLCSLYTQTPWDNLRELEVRRECARALANMCAVPSLGTQLIAALRTPAQAHSAEVLSLLLPLLYAKALTSTTTAAVTAKCQW